MSWVDGALSDFGRQLGLPELRFPAGGGAVSLEFERTGTLFFEELDECVLVYLVRSLDRADVTAFEQALDACHWRHDHPFAVQPGLHGDTDLALSLRIPRADFQLPTIERAVNFLRRMHEAVREGVFA